MCEISELRTNALSTSISGLYIAWRLRHQTKLDYLSSNGTQKGQKTCTIVQIRMQLRLGRKPLLPPYLSLHKRNLLYLPFILTHA